jgi:FCD domain
VQPLASVIRELREETSSAPETREHAIDYHGRILRRVADRDSEGARDEMREHLVLTEVQRGVDQGPGVLGRAAEVLSRALVGWGGDAEMCTLRVACSMTKKA